MKNTTLQQQPGAGNMVAQVEQAKKAPRVNACTVDQTKQTLLYVFALIGLTGSTLPDEGQKMVLIDYLHRELTGYSLQDIKNAFTLYVQKKLDYTEKHYYNFSVMLLENVMQSYKRYCVNIPSFSRPALPQKTDPTPAEIEERNKRGCINCFARYGHTGTLQDIGNATYDYVTQIGLMRLDDDKKWEYYNKAKKTVIDISTAKSMMGKLPEKLSTIMQRITNGTETSIAQEAKRLALASWFDELIEMDTELKDLIE